MANKATIENERAPSTLYRNRPRQLGRDGLLYSTRSDPTLLAQTHAMMTLNTLPDKTHRDRLRARIYRSLHAAGRDGGGVERTGAVREGELVGVDGLEDEEG